MGLNTLEMHFTEKAASYIHEAGGKIGGLNYLKAAVPQLRHAILPVQVIRCGERLTNITVPAGDDGRYIFRGSDPRDFQGLVDVLKTEVGDKTEVTHLVDEVQRHARLPEVLAYGQYENPGYKGKITVGIQPFLDCQRGSIVEHPNRPNNYVISFVPKDYEPGMDSTITFIYNTEEDELKHICGPHNEIEGGVDVRPRQIVELYKLVDSSGIVKPGLSLQMEFLNAPDQVFVAQVRVFMRKQLAAFELEGDEKLVFGITTPSGVILPVYLSTDGFSSGDYPNYETPWAYLKFCEKRRGARDLFNSESEEEKVTKALKFNPRNLAAYLIGQSVIW